MTETTPLNMQQAFNQNTSPDDVESGVTQENNSDDLELTPLNEGQSNGSKSTNPKWSILVPKRSNVTIDPDLTNKDASENEDESAQG